MAHAGGTCIIGAGIIGLSTAYYLSLSSRTAGSSIHLIESSPELFASASGYAGGFLAADWFAPALAELGALSFRLHKELADAHNGQTRWGYSRSTGTSLASTAAGGSSGYDWLRHGGSRATTRARHEFWGDAEGPAWLARRDGEDLDIISEGESTAQVDPRRLCAFLLEECEKRGVAIHPGTRVGKLSKNCKGQMVGVGINPHSGAESELPCTRLVITAGAWTREVFSDLFPHAKTRPRISALAGHSLVVRSPRWRVEHENKGCHAVFATNTDGFSPEIFSRIGSEIYVAGLNDSELPLPRLASNTKPDPAAIDRLRQVANHMLGIPGTESDLETIRGGLCFRPVAKGNPIVSRVTNALLGEEVARDGADGGVFVSAGHGPWGISQSLGTGKVMSELIQGEELSADIEGLQMR